MKYFASMWIKGLQNCKKSNSKFARTFNEILCIHVTKRAAKLQEVDLKVREKDVLRMQDETFLLDKDWAQQQIHWTIYF